MTQSHLSYGLVDRFEGGLLVVVVHASVSVQDVDPVVFGGGAVAAVDAVIRTVIPLARKLQQELWDKREGGGGGGDR